MCVCVDGGLKPPISRITSFAEDGRLWPFLEAGDWGTGNVGGKSERGLDLCPPEPRAWRGWESGARGSSHQNAGL